MGAPALSVGVFEVIAREEQGGDDVRVAGHLKALVDFVDEAAGVDFAAL